MCSAVTLLFVLGSVPAAGSVPEPGQAPAAEEVRTTGLRMDVPVVDNKSSAHMWLWSKGKRGYLLTSPQNYYQFEGITAYDLDTGLTLGEGKLDPPANAGRLISGSAVGAGRDMLMAVDEEEGRLFIATQNTELGDAQRGASDAASSAAQGRPCLHVAFVSCFNGVSVVDAETLQSERHIPFRTLTLDGLILAPQLLAMEYAPAVEGQPAKVHVLVQEWAHGPTGSDVAGLANPKRVAPNSTFLAQLDPESGLHDWTVRVDACRGGRLGTTNNETTSAMGLTHEATVFRSQAPGDAAVYVGCTFDTQSLAGGVVRVPLDADGRPVGAGVPAPPQPSLPSPEDASQGPPSQPPTMPAAERPIAVEGPDRIYEMMADPASGRIVMQVIDGNPKAMVWWVFDTSVMRFIGTVGIGGPVDFGSTMSTLSREAGRLYVLAQEKALGGKAFPGGLYVADIRRSPVPQALHYPALADQYPAKVGNVPFRHALAAQATAEGPIRIWHVNGTGSQRTAYLAMEDHRPIAEVAPEDDFAGRTLDIPEEEGVTSVSLDGAARGYGFRSVLVSGAEAAARMGPFDPLGLVDQCNDASWGNDARQDLALATADALLSGDALGAFNSPESNGYGGAPCGDILAARLPNQCTQADREVIFASVGPEAPAVLDGTGGRGAARPFSIDSGTAADTQAAASRCAEKDWDQVWSVALFGRAPADEPAIGQAAEERLAACTASSADTSQQVGDPVADGYSAHVQCGDEETSGHAYTRGASVEGVNVAEAISSFRIYLDPGRGVVSRVESVARGIAIDGAARIDSVRGVAESWANGRKQAFPLSEAEQGYDPNCDMERTAGTCFRRHLFGLSVPGYRCGPCGDEQAFIDALNRVFNPYAAVRLRNPDERLRRGADNGFTAAIQKPEADRFADLVLNNDLLQTVLPTLEFIRTAPPNRFPTRQGARGRQIYQFAGVEVSSSYGIACLLVYDEAANTCAEPAEAPGSIQVTLSDTEGKPLAGGGFEVRADVDADGVLGLKDTLLPDGACVTAEDGIGTCSFENLQPGTYLVSQVAAPPGYAKSAEPWVSEVASGEQRTVAFTNVSNVSTIDLKATDEHGAPISGATFAAYPDPDSDGKVAPDAQPAAECTTDAQGVCQMKVPAGSYVLVQTSAPGGLEGIEPVPFTFASGGQVASVSVVNYPPASPQQPEGAASPIYTPPVDYAPPVESVTEFTPVADVPVVEEPAVSVPERIGGTVTQVIRAPGDALRLLARDPKQAVAWTAALALFGLAVMAVRRRRDVVGLLSK